MPKTFLGKKFCSWCGGHIDKVTDSQLVCQTCQTAEYNNPSPATGILVINAKDELLIITRGREPLKGFINIPGGFIEGSEDAIVTATRELQEETEMTIDKSELQLIDVAMHDYEFQGNTRPVVMLLYVVRLTDTPKVKPHDDVAKAEWRKADSVDFNKFAWPEIANKVKAYLHSENML